MAFSNTSRYLLTEVIEVRHPVTNELSKPPFVDLRQRFTAKSADDRAFLYDSVDDWAAMGLRFLGDARAWWVMADLSSVVDPFDELTEGIQLRIPSVERFELEILPSDRGLV